MISKLLSLTTVHSRSGQALIPHHPETPADTGQQIVPYHEPGLPATQTPQTSARRIHRPMPI